MAKKKAAAPTAEAPPLSDREEKRLRYAREALPLADLERDYAEARENLRMDEAAEADRQEQARIRLREQRKALGAIATRRSIATQADKRLRAEFIEPTLILAESAAAQAVGQAQLAEKLAHRDLKSFRHEIDMMKKRGLAKSTIDREEKRASEFEIRVAQAEKRYAATRAQHVKAQAAIEAAWEEARSLEPRHGA